MSYGNAPRVVADGFNIGLGEVMYYLYLPVKMPWNAIVKLPNNLVRLWPLINMARDDAQRSYGMDVFSRYIYVSARKGWASPDNPLNRPGWHCDGFGTEDINYVYWSGPGTRFAVGKMIDVSDDHVVSLEQFDEFANGASATILTLPERNLVCLDRYCIHSTPLIAPPGCMREYIKVSISKERYNLENNSHNYLFDYDWTMYPRDIVRNDTSRAQRDYT